MDKIRYYFKRLRIMDWQGFFDAVNYAKEKSGKAKIYIFFDMVISSILYGSGYVDYNEFEFYDLSHKQKKTFLTLSDSHKVTRKYNDPKGMAILDDKAKFVKMYSEFVKRDYIDLREVSPSTFQAFLEKHRKVMAKRTTDYVGRGIDKIDIDDGSIIDYEQLYQDLLNNRQYLVEVFFKQHEKMNELSDKSVNTLRIITFLDDFGVPQVLVRVLKSGLGKHLDNIGQGGMYTILNEAGIVEYPFIDKYGNHHRVNPITGKNLIGFAVPHYKEVENQVKKACLIMPSVRYMGWDVAVSPEGDAELIEGNTTTGPFQVIPSFTKDKRGVRPIYEKYMDMKF